MPMSSKNEEEEDLNEYEVQLIKNLSYVASPDIFQ